MFALFFMEKFLNNAVVFTGQLRCIQNNFEHIRKLSQHFNIFFCTSLNGTSELDLLTATKLGKLIFIDKNDECSKEEVKLLSLNEGVKILQWQKLFHAFNILKKDYAFDNIIKLRTDIDFSSCVIEELISHKFTASTIYMYSDICFAGKWNDMYILSKFYSHFTDYYENHQSVTSFDNFVDHDFSAAKFLWLHYPLSIANNVYDVISAPEEKKNKNKKSQTNRLN